MSLNKSTTRRLSLLTGSSLVAASLTALVTVGAALAPTAAAAQVTCVSGTAVTGNGTNNVTIAGGNPNNPGITCAFVGDNALVSTLAATTVSTIAPGGGINLSAPGDDSINWNSTAGTVSGGAQTNGPVIDALANTGDINITTGGVTGTAATVTHGIRAISSGGDITLNTGAVSASNTTSGQYAIQAATTGSGNIAITTNGAINGRIRSILATTTGAGRAELIINGNVSGGGVEISSAAGGFNITINSGTTASLHTTSSGAGEILVTGGALASGSGQTANVVHRASGSGNLTLNLEGAGNLGGVLDYSLLTGDATINVNSDRTANAGWNLGLGTSVFGSGNDSIHVSRAGIIRTSLQSTLDFGAGDDHLSNAGVLLIGGAGDPTSSAAAQLTIADLDSFTNSGVIVLGYVRLASLGYDWLDLYDMRSDLEANDRLVLHDSRFVGEEGSRIYLDASLGATTQTSCVTLTAADCLDFQGTTTEGRTLIRVRDTSPSFDGFRNDGIVLIDVAGGSSSADHFELDPGSMGYVEESTLGPIIRKGLIAYDLIYDEDTEQHVLVGVLAPEAYQFQVLPSLALNAWRTTTGTWFDRQADLRDTLGEPRLSKGMWARAAADFTSRDVAADFLMRGDTLTFDQSHEQKTGAVVVGADLVSAESESHGFVFGAMLGFSNSVTEFDASPTKVEFTGPTGGLYASYVGGPLFLDGVVSASLLNMNQDSPGLNLGEGVRLKQDVTVVGAQLEGGWRMQFGGGFFAEPLAAFSWVRTEFEDIDDAAANTLVDFDDKAVSRRAALGLRVGMDSTLGPARAKYSLTGRAWNEFEGENGLVLDLPGESMAMSDDLSGTFGEVGAGVSLSDDTGLISGFLNGNVKFQEDYRSAGFSAGVRLRW